MSNCLFCKIVAKEIPAKIAFENERVLAFHDINPQAPLHLLIIPKKHIATINDIDNQDAELIGEMICIARDLAKQFDVAEDGFRLNFNCNEHGGQEVYHIHLHLLAGRKLTWPPG